MKDLKVYAFTNWGLVKGKVVKERIDKFTNLPQFQLEIDVNKDNKNKVYNFWFTSEQLFPSKVKAILSLLK